MRITFCAFHFLLLAMKEKERKLSSVEELNCSIRSQLRSVNTGYRAIAEEFVENSTIHGFSHLTSSRSFSRRIFWCLLLLISHVAFFWLVKKNVDKMQKHDTVVKTAVYYSNSLPFPALTLCNVNRFRKSKTGSLMQNWMKFFLHGELVVGCSVFVLESTINSKV